MGETFVIGLDGSELFDQLDDALLVDVETDRLSAVLLLIQRGRSLDFLRNRKNIEDERLQESPRKPITLVWHARDKRHLVRLNEMRKHLPNIHPAPARFRIEAQRLQAHRKVGPALLVT